EQAGARQRAAELEERKLSVCRRYRGQVLRFGDLREARFGNEIERGLDFEPMLGGIEHLVQLVQKACHPEEVPGVGQLPESDAEAELIAVRRRERRDERVVKYRHARQLT